MCSSGNFSSGCCVRFLVVCSEQYLSLYGIMFVQVLCRHFFFIVVILVVLKCNAKRSVTLSVRSYVLVWVGLRFVLTLVLGLLGGVYCGDLVIQSMAGKSFKIGFAYKVEQIGYHIGEDRRRYTPLSVLFKEV